MRVIIDHGEIAVVPKSRVREVPPVKKAAGQKRRDRTLLAILGGGKVPAGQKDLDGGGHRCRGGKKPFTSKEGRKDGWSQQGGITSAMFFRGRGSNRRRPEEKRSEAGRGEGTLGKRGPLLPCNARKNADLGRGRSRFWGFLKRAAHKKWELSGGKSMSSPYREV